MAVTIDGTLGVTSPDFEPSGSTAPTNGLYLPTTNTVALATNSTERLRLDASGNLGLGVTPSSWGSAASVVQFANKNSLLGGASAGTFNGGFLSVCNAYHNGTSWIYTTSNYSTLYQTYNGLHLWYTAPSGTAGNAISFTQAMTLDASGNLGIGTTSPSVTLHLNSAVSNTAKLRVGRSTSDSNYIQLGTNGGSSVIVANGVTGTAGELIFGNDANTGTYTERARIDSSGNLLVGTTSASSGYGLKVANGGLLVNSSQGGNNLVVFENTSTSGYGISVSCNNSNTTYRYFEGYSSSAAAQKIAIFTDGNVRIAAGSTYGNLSDASLKTDIVDASPKLADVCALRVRNFATLEDAESKYIGFIAQEFETVFPSLVTTSTDVYKDGREIKGIKESALIPILVKAIQELTARLEALEGAN